MKKTTTDNTGTKRPPLVVELIGPAGAGKTTLLRALSQCNPVFVKGSDLRVRRMENIPFFVSNALFLLPTFLRQYRNGRWFTWYEVKRMVYLQGWYHVLRRQTSNNGAVTILDQGPVFKLARLQGFGPENINSPRFEKWWDTILKQWAATLDVVIWLDAPDAILLERIHARDQWCRAKDQSEQEAHRFLARYRTSYEQMISALTANGGPRVLRFDTAQESLGQIVDQVLAAFGLGHSEG